MADRRVQAGPERPPALRRRLETLYAAVGIAPVYTRLKLWILPSEFSAHLPERGRILDVGCGYGLLANYMSLAGPDREILGFDVARDRVEIARRTVGDRPGLEFRVARLQDLGEGGFDGAMIADVLHHLPYADQPGLLAGVHAKLKPGGVLVIRETDVKPRLRYVLFNWLLEWALYLGSEKLRFRKAAEWIRLLESAGFTVRSVVPNRWWFPYITATFVCVKAPAAAATPVPKSA